MADSTLAATISNVIAFPTRNKGRIRKSNSPESMGRCSISLLERDGESVPENVFDFRCAREEAPVDESRLALLLALSVFSTLNAKQKKSILNPVRMYARHDDDRRGAECRALYRLITRSQPSC